MGQIESKIRKALQPMLEVFSGLLIRATSPFRKGDFIEIDGRLGSVEHKGIRFTILRSIDGEPVHVPNTLFFTKHLHNLSHQNIVNVDLETKVCYSENMAKIKKLINDYLSNNKLVLRNPSPKVVVKKMKNSHVELGVKVWCSLEKYLEVDAETELLLNQFLISQGVKVASENTAAAKLMA